MEGNVFNNARSRWNAEKKCIIWFQVKLFFSDLNETKLTTALSMRDVVLIARSLKFKVT